MSEELKPVRCGCGGEAKVYRNIFVQNPETHIYVCCEECLTRSSYFPTEAEAITAWNTAMGERTAKAKVNFKDENYFFGWCECGQYQSSQFPYCPACGARLEWK